MRHFDYQFVGRIEMLDFGRMIYKVIWLPVEIEARLPFSKYPRLRIDAMIAGVFINCAFQIGKGRRYLILSSDFIKQAGVDVPQYVTVSFSIADQSAVDIPLELELALRKDRRAEKLWSKLSPGKQRGYAYRIASAKRQETIEKRIEEVLEDIINTNEK